MSRERIKLIDYLDPVNGDADLFEISESLAHKLQDKIEKLEDELEQHETNIKREYNSGQL
jgi:hypothetical protein